MEKLLSKIFEKIEKEPWDYQAYEDMYNVCRDVIKEDIPLAVKYLRILSDCLEEQIPRCGENIRDFFMLHKRELRLAAPHSFYCYLLYVEFEREPEKKFFLPRRKVLTETVDYMQKLADDELDLLTVSMPPGSGKAQPLWCNVLTPNGFKPMGEIKIGDKVITPKNKIANVVGIFPQGKQEYYSITMNDGSKTYCTSEHLWKVQTREDRNKRRHGENGRYRVIDTQTMSKNVHIENGKRLNYSIDYVDPIEFEKKELLIDPYLMGVILGDGGLTSGSIVISNPDSEIISEVEKRLPTGDKLTQFNEIHYRITKAEDKRNDKGYLMPSKTSMAIREYGLHDCVSDTKFIPADYMNSCIEDRWDLLCGLLDTDGSTNKSVIEFSTTSRIMAQQVRSIVHSLGGYCTISEKQGSYTKGGERIECKMSYRVVIQFTKGRIPFKLTRKAKKYNPKREVIKRFVSNIALQGETECQCILLDDEEHLYVTDDYIITHNTTLGIFFLSWVMGREPDGQNLASAHSGTLTRSFYDGVMGIITDPDYLWSDVFPVKLASTNSKEETIDLNKRHRFSTLTCRAINASLTGATRCDQILYADDLCSGIEEAMSKERLDKLWMTYTNDLKSRKKMSAKEIHIATRWSVHDVIGRLEREYGSDPRAKFVVLPALDENGESNFDYDYGVGFDKQYFEDMKSNLDEASFKALFMNEPIEREGLLYHSEELRRFYELPSEEPDGIIAVCDTKDRGKDYCAMPIAYVYGSDYYIADVVFNNGLPEIVDGQIVSKLLSHKVKMCRFESNAAGGRVADKIQEELKTRGGITHITKKYSTANKETRIILASAWVKEHVLFLDSPKDKEYRDFINQACSYTVAGRNTNDDGVDSLAMLAEFAQSLSGGRVEAFKRPW